MSLALRFRINMKCQFRVELNVYQNRIYTHTHVFSHWSRYRARKSFKYENVWCYLSHHVPLLVLPYMRIILLQIYDSKEIFSSIKYYRRGKRHAIYTLRKYGVFLCRFEYPLKMTFYNLNQPNNVRLFVIQWFIVKYQ